MFSDSAAFFFQVPTWEAVAAIPTAGQRLVKM